jgi:large repetitive protein
MGSGSLDFQQESPSVAVDSNGNIFVAFIESTTAQTTGWSLYYSYEDGCPGACAGWSTNHLISTVGSGYDYGVPSASIYSSGGTDYVCIVWDEISTGASYIYDGYTYFVGCASGTTPATLGSWTITNGLSADGDSADYIAAPSGTFDPNTGTFLVVFQDTSSDYYWVDKYTDTGSFSATEQKIKESTYYGYEFGLSIGIACATSGCAFQTWGVGETTSGTNCAGTSGSYYVFCTEVFTSAGSNDYSSFNNYVLAYAIETGGSYPEIDAPDHMGISGSGTNWIAGYQYFASSSSVYGVVCYSTDGTSLWQPISGCTTAYSPTGSLNPSVYPQSALAVVAAGSAEFVAWEDTSSNLHVDSATSMGGSFVASATVPSNPSGDGGYYASMAYWPGTAAYPWMVDVGFTTSSHFDVDFTYYQRPTLTAFTPSPTSGDVGQSVTWTPTLTEGSGTISSYLWSATSGNFGCGATTGATYTCTPTTTTGEPFAVGFDYTDSWGFTSLVYGSQSYTVYADPTVAISPTGTTLSYDVGQAASSITATVTYSGPNTAAVTFYKAASSAACSTSAPWSSTGSGSPYTPSTASAGTTYYCAIVTDSGVAGYTSGSGVETVVVYADPTVAISPTGGTLSFDVGQTASSLTATITYSGPNTATVTYYSSPSSAACSTSAPWSSTGVSGGSGKTYTPSTASAGTTYYCAVVTDSGVGGYASGSGVETVTVYADPTVAISPTGGTVTYDVSQSASVITGTITYSGPNTATLTFYSAASSAACSTSAPWTSTGVSGASGKTYTPSTASIGTTYYCAVVTDSGVAGYSSGSGVEIVTVYNDPTLGAPSPSPASGGIDVGQATTFTVTITTSNGYPDGSGTWTWHWTQSSTNFGCNAAASWTTTSTPNSGTTTASCTPTVQGTTYTLSVYVTDPDNCNSGGGSCASSATSSAAYIVYNDPSLGTPAPSPASGGIDVGQTTTFTVSITTSNGYPDSAGTWTWHWTQSSTSFGCNAAASWTTTSTPSAGTTTAACTPSAQGASYALSVYVTDPNNCNSGGANCASAAVSSASFTVDSDPSLTSLATTSPVACSSGCSADNGQTLTVTTTASAGSGGYTMTWGDGASSYLTGCSSGGSNPYTYSCTVSVSATESVSITAEVKDSNGCFYPSPCGGGTISISVTLYVDPTVSSVSSSPVSGGGEAGQAYTISASAAGGTQSYNSWSWTALPPGCTNSGTTTVSCTPTVGGVFSLQVSAKDTNGYSFSTSTSIIIEPAGAYLPSASQLLGPAGPADVGGTVAFNTTASGGTGYYVQFTWTESDPGLGCASVNADLISCTPTAPGDYSITVSVTDSDGKTSHPQTFADFSVNSPLTAGQISSSALVIDDGQSTSLNAGVPSGGTAPYAYQWLAGASSTCASDAPVAGATSSSLAANPTTSTYYCLEVGDSSSGSPTPIAYSIAVLVTVDPALAASGLAPASPFLDNGGSLTLTPGAMGGASPYQYAWFSSSTGTGACVSGQSLGVSSTLLVQPTASTYYCVLVTDSSQGSPAAGAVSTWDLVTVDPALSTGPIAPGSPAIDLGQALLLTSLETGGTPGFSYTWFSSLAGSGACTLGTQVPGAQGSSLQVLPSQSTYYCYQVVDSSYGAPFAQSSAWDLITVNAALSAAAPTISAASIDATQTSVLTAGATGGTPTLTYQWFESSAGGICSAKASPIPGATAASLTTPSTLSAGPYDFCYAVSDHSSAGSILVYSASIPLTVQPDPTLSPIEMVGPVDCSTQCSATAGQILLVSATAGLGTDAYQFQWAVADGSTACSGSASGGATSTYACTVGAVAAPESWTVTLVVTDSNGCHAPGGCASPSTISFSVTLYPATSLSNILETSPVSCASACSADSGQTLSVETTASGGSGTYAFTWSISAGASGCEGSATGATTSTYSCAVGALSSAETWTITATVSGATGGPESFTVTLEPDPIGALSAVPASGNLVAGQAVTFTDTASGGSGTYSGWSWTALPSGCVGSTASVLTCTPTTGGVFTVTVEFSDSNGFGPVSASSPFIVHPAASELQVSLSTESTTVSIGDAVTVSAVVSGGTPPITLSWTMNGEPIPGATSVSYTFVPSGPGTYTLTVTVSGSAGVGATSASLTITAGSSSGHASTSGWAGSAVEISVGVAGVLALLGVAVLLRRRRRAEANPPREVQDD